MGFTGQIYERTEDGVASLAADLEGNFMVVRISVGQNEVMRFPMATDTDSNELTLRTTNIINQTGLLSNTCRVEIDQP